VCLQGFIGDKNHVSSQLRPATSANCELFVNLANQNMEYRPKTVS
jgi:hypothetical protein